MQMFVLLSFVLGLIVSGTSFAADASAAPAKGGSLVLATTTSTQATGLLDVLLAKCTEATGISVKAVAVGTGRALELAKNGDADVVIFHARALEYAFVAEGLGVHVYDLMYNDFVIAVSNAKIPGAKTGHAIAFIDWLVGPQGQEVIRNFKIDGEEIFHLSVGKRK